MHGERLPSIHAFRGRHHVMTAFGNQTDTFGALARFAQLWIDELDKLCQCPGETLLPFDFYD